MIMKYKIGDKVVLRDDLIAGNFYRSCSFTREMRDSMGQVVEIIGIDADDDFKIDESGCYYSVEMIDHEKTKKLDKTNTPLRLYQLFEYYLKKENQNNEFIDDRNNRYRFCNLRNNIEMLIDGHDTWNDITSALYSNTITKRRIRPYTEARKMTLREVEDKLGYPVEIIE